MCTFILYQSSFHVCDIIIHHAAKKNICDMLFHVVKAQCSFVSE